MNIIYDYRKLRLNKYLTSILPFVTKTFKNYFFNSLKNPLLSRFVFFSLTEIKYITYKKKSPKNEISRIKTKR